MATLCTCRHDWLQHAKGGFGGGCSIDDCPCAGFKVRAPSDLVADGETALAADLWARLVTIWESYQSDDGVEEEIADGFMTAIGALVDEWQGFADKKPAPVAIHYIYEGKAVCGVPGPLVEGPVDCKACLSEVRAALDAAREQAEKAGRT